MVKDMTKARRQAALLRNLMETCLKAAPAPMTGRELADWPSIQEHTGTGLSGYSKLGAQLTNMVKKGLVEKLGQGMTTTYRWLGKAEQVAKAHSRRHPMPELHLRIDKAKHTLSFIFGGMRITLEVAE